ncbi:response regulator transcription factor [Pseudoalteromonas sp. JBTF-M23]|uniref:Response regulator transcription factor n=1 Tax=Pseudoalteromonas caenipelagi TaxID=2726988 RepID=A0A849VL55_9GAMM|nr:response regulator transcription factor [Pseudoalteromonas caenipelagi]NOU52504.1 response regulator transcription factor [Pseudoalteromonas caenipelagi]
MGTRQAQIKVSLGIVGINMGKVNCKAAIVTRTAVCRTDENLESIRSLLKLLNISSQVLECDKALVELPIEQLVFVDLTGFTCEEVYSFDMAVLAKRKSLILFNACEGQVDERRALLAGVKGVIYAKDEPDIKLKGIKAVKDGELWFRRSIISSTFSELLVEHAIFSNPTPTPKLEDGTFNLTKREKTIVKLIAEGAQNKEIANKLHISDHTVKTHLYSAFRKTKSRNRIELLNWARQFFPDALTRSYSE